MSTRAQASRVVGVALTLGWIPWALSHGERAQAQPVSAPRGTVARPLPGRARLGLGDGHGCVVRASGQVLCWGANERGQLGDGTRVSRDEPRPLSGVTDAAAVALAARRTCVLHRDGHVSCVGGEGGDALRPVEGLAGVEALFGDERGNLWALQRGQVLCAGDPSSSGCGVEGATRDRAVAVPGVGGVVSARSLWGSVGSNCFLLRDGTLRCPRASPGPWRQLRGLTDFFEFEGVCGQVAGGAVQCTDYRGVRAVPSLRGAVQLAHNQQGSLVCGLSPEGGVRCLGDTAHPEGGAGPGEGFRPARELAVEGGTACALGDDGAVRCWGDSVRFSLRPVVGLTGASGVSASQFLTCATAGSVGRCWGLGHTPPVSLPLGRGSTVRALDSLACEVRRDGVLRCPGLFSRDRPEAALTDLGYNYHNEYARSPEGLLLRRSHQGTTAPFSPMPELTGVRSLAVNDHGACVVLADGAARCGDWIFQGGLEMNLPRVRGLSGVRALASDVSWGCALHGEGLVSCWGEPFAPRWELPPGQGPEATPSGLTDAVALSGEGTHVCALRRGGRVSCWGRSSLGALGTGREVESAPSDLGLTGVTALSVAVERLCLVREGRVYCVGHGRHGVLGDGSGTSTPWVQVPPEGEPSGSRSP